MNLYFRLLYTLIHSFFQPRIKATDPLVLRFRTWPTDLDTNLHMNNGRYLTLMDLGRVQLMIRAGMVKKIFKNRWMPVVGECHIRFRRSLSPFQAFELHTRILSWDEKWVYIEHKFFSGNELMAQGVIKGLFKKPGGNLSSKELLHAMDFNDSPPHPVPTYFQNAKEIQ